MRTKEGVRSQRAGFRLHALELVAVVGQPICKVGSERTRYLYPSPSTNNGRSPDHPGALGVYLDAHAISSSVRVMINYNYNF